MQVNSISSGPDASLDSSPAPDLGVITKEVSMALSRRAVLPKGTHYIRVTTSAIRIKPVNVSIIRMCVLGVAKKVTNASISPQQGREMEETNPRLLHPQLQQAKTFRKAPLLVQMVVKIAFILCLLDKIRKTLVMLLPIC